MSSSTTRGPAVVLGLAFALSGFAQITKSDLRAKYGAPDTAGIFTVPPNIALKVEYGSKDQACRFEFSSVVPTNQQVDDILAGLVPLSMRGKELMGIAVCAGAVCAKTQEYERVIITVSYYQEERKDVTVSFDLEGCPPLRRISTNPPSK